jgi:hypothetical protein
MPHPHSPNPNHAQTLVPTPYGEVAEQWWYYTRGFMSLQWDGQELPLEEVPPILQSCLDDLLREMMFPSLTIGLEVLVISGNTGRLMTTAEQLDSVPRGDDQSELTWDDFTLVSSHSPSTLTSRRRYGLLPTGAPIRSRRRWRF